MAEPSKKKQKARRQPSGPKTLEGSREAKQRAAMILEVLSGVRGPTEACEVLDLSLPRYYILETRALQALILALEPRPRGRRRTTEKVIAELEAEKAQLQRELLRSQALIRSAHRAIGLKGSSEKAKKARRRRPNRRSRGKKVIETLRDGQDPAPAPKTARQDAP